MQDPARHEDSSAASPRMQSSTQVGESSSTRRRCRIRGNSKTQIRQRGEARNPGQPGDPARKRRQGSEDAGRPADSPKAAGRCSIRGNPGTHRWRCGDRESKGQPEASLVRNVEGCEPRGNSRIHRWQSRKTGSSGLPGRSSQALLKDRSQGKPEAPPKAPLKGVRFEATRGSIAGKAGGCRDWGDPKPHRRHYNGSGGPGQPGALIPGRAEGCETRVKLRLHRRHRQSIESLGQPGRSSLALPDARRVGATRSFPAGAAEGREVQGNLSLHRWHSRKVQAEGQPET